MNEYCDHEIVESKQSKHEELENEKDQTSEFERITTEDAWKLMGGLRVSSCRKIIKHGCRLRCLVWICLRAINDETDPNYIGIISFLIVNSNCISRCKKCGVKKKNCYLFHYML